MKQLSVFSFLLLWLLSYSCGSKKKFAADEPGATIFGLYEHRSVVKATIELHPDSSATLTVAKGSMPEPLKNEIVNKTGTFSLRNDSILITWQTGSLIKGKFEKKKEGYTFRIGSTTYKQKW